MINQVVILSTGVLAYGAHDQAQPFTSPPPVVQAVRQCDAHARALQAFYQTQADRTAFWEVTCRAEHIVLKRAPRQADSR